jgi:hypothetical protein
MRREKNGEEKEKESFEDGRHAPSLIVLFPS